MNIRNLTKSATLAAGFAFAAIAFSPAAQAHACNGPGTITIKAVKNPHTGKDDYYYFQHGRVCGRFTT